MSEKIFISYRREDSRGVTGRIYDRLEARFGRERIFMDVDTIQPGMDFVEAIENAVSESDVFLVVIGPNWLNSVDAMGKRRLENPNDFVRLEVASALKRGIRVIPVLVENAMMPSSEDLQDNLQALTRRNAIEISHTRFSMDADKLIRVIEDIFESLDTQHSVEEIEEPEPTPVKPQVVESGTKTQKPLFSQLILTAIYWTLGGVVGGAFHWYPYVSLLYVIFFAGTSGLLSGVGLGLILRNKEPDGWIKQLAITIIGNVLIGKFIRGLFVLHIGDIIIVPLLIPPIVTGLLYGLWKGLLSRK